MRILADREPRITVHLSPYIAWQGVEREMPPHVRRVWEAQR